MDTPKPFRIEPDGTMLFKSGPPPPDNIPGYYHKGDKHVWYPDFASDCIHRYIEKRVKPCGAMACSFMCRLLEKGVNQLVCNSCDKVEEPK